MALAVPLNRLADIAIRVERPTRAGGLGGGVAAILTEMIGLLDGLANGARPAAIDLRSLPMSAEDRTELQQILGEGEVQATVNAGGLSSIRETRISGVWWVEHRDDRGELIAELIEVTRVPEILASALDEIAAGARELRSRIAVLPAQTDGREHVSRQ